MALKADLNVEPPRPASACPSEPSLAWPSLAGQAKSSLEEGGVSLVILIHSAHSALERLVWFGGRGVAEDY